MTQKVAGGNEQESVKFNNKINELSNKSKACFAPHILMKGIPIDRGLTFKGLRVPGHIMTGKLDMDLGLGVQVEFSGKGLEAIGELGLIDEARVDIGPLCQNVGPRPPSGRLPYRESLPNGSALPLWRRD